jgi:putative nucleotidyltransferase with HDIG domain
MPPSDSPSRYKTAAYIALVVASGLAVLIHGLKTWGPTDWTRYLTYCAIALIASGMKVKLPGVTGTMSMSFLFVLIGISELGFPRTLVIGCLCMVVQCLLHAEVRPKPVQVIFNLASIACSIEACFRVYRLVSQHGTFEAPLRLLIAASAYFATNTLSIATVIALTEGKRARDVWRESYMWTFPNYLMGAAVAWAVSAVSKAMGWQTSLLMLPVLYLLFRTHTLYIHRLEGEKQLAEDRRKHAEEVAALNRRAIETLALAIEAKDQTTHDHLNRVEVYAVEIGKELGLNDTGIEALRAAALLHDVGKLAVPEYIISKPGKLTPEEFEKMKTHTIVGAELVEQIGFPYPVAPIVRSHHEKWNGTGYPDGLSGEQIPIGARILSTVDCLDALASDRQYRRALPLDKAIQVIQSEAGKSFDPRVAEVLVRRCAELERMARTSANKKTKLSTDVKIARGEAPAAGFEVAANVSASHNLIRLRDSIAGTAKRPRLMATLTQQLETAEDLDTALCIVRGSLREVISYDVMAVYLRSGERLVPATIDGEDYRQFASLEIPFGTGLSGWVAESRKSILNGNPSVEPGYLTDPTKFSLLHSALAVPLESQKGLLGVLSLYRQESDAFGQEHLTALVATGAALAEVLERVPGRSGAAVPLA